MRSRAWLYRPADCGNRRACGLQGSRRRCVSASRDTINRGEIHIEEVDLDGLVNVVVSRGLLKASTRVSAADVFIIAVPTPFDADHAPDISYVLAAGEAVAGVLKVGDTVILESTSPVGTTEALRDLIARLRPDLKCPGMTSETPDVSIAYCPERVLPGKILEELASNDRWISGITPRCARKAGLPRVARAKPWHSTSGSRAGPASPPIRAAPR